MGAVSKVHTAAVVGLDAEIIEVEADISNGLPATIIVGLPDAAVQESRERVKAAIRNSRTPYPPTRVSVNLAPADVPKAGTHYDLPIALAIMQAAESIDFDADRKLFVGELSLDGATRPVPGILAIALAAKAAGMRELYVPRANTAEASLVDGITVFGVDALQDLVGHLLDIAPLSPETAAIKKHVFRRAPTADMRDVAGQELAKRALEVACAGGHNTLLYGPPGSGKTLLAKACPGLLPSLSFDETLELTKIYSIAGKLKDGVITDRPVRNPHHTTSNVALVGGGTVPKPGEITLAHRGILFLDEFPEFPRSVLEALRQPLEDGIVTVSRAKNTLTFPAKFILIAAQNPCPCGYHGDTEKRCTCSAAEIAKYEKKISGPLLDRIDLHIEVARLPYDKLMRQKAEAESSETIRARVEQSRAIQAERLGGSRTNSEMTAEEVKRYCPVDDTGHKLLEDATKRYALSGRSIHRLLKVARTIADLAKLPEISLDNLAEAMQYRPQQQTQMHR